MLCIQRTSTGEGQLSACFVLGSHKLYFSLTIDVCLHVVSVEQVVSRG